MTLPTIHLNGTSLQALMDANDKAYRALGEAMEALAQAAPNGRDYYPQGPDALRAAISEHETRMGLLVIARRELEKIGEHLGEEECRRLSTRAYGRMAATTPPSRGAAEVRLRESGNRGEA